MRLIWTLAFVLGTSVPWGSLDAQNLIDVWLDVDPAIGFGEVDDGVTMVQAFHSPELRLRGVSVVFGNSTLSSGVNVAVNLVRSFGPEDMEVYRGAASPEEFGAETDAVRAMAQALRVQPMTILALGPVTNVGTLVRNHPELHDRIEQIVVVAGRRPGQRFITTDQSRQNFPRDFNFESDVPAMQAILDTGIRLVMAPWEVSSQVWISRSDLESIRTQSLSAFYIWANTHHWLDSWVERRGVAAFNPYDALAVGYLTHPELIQGTEMDVEIELGPDERATPEELAAGRTKPYLHVREADRPARPALYLHTPSDDFRVMLLDRLVGPP